MNVKALIPTYKQQGITVNLFKDYRGTGPWLYVWTPIGQAIADGVVKEGDEIPPELVKQVSLGMKLERELRDEFVRLASADYAKAVEAVRATVLAATIEFLDDEAEDVMPVSILDRGIEH